MRKTRIMWPTLCSMVVWLKITILFTRWNSLVVILIGTQTFYRWHFSRIGTMTGRVQQSINWNSCSWRSRSRVRPGSCDWALNTHGDVFYYVEYELKKKICINWWGSIASIAADGGKILLNCWDCRRLLLLVSSRSVSLIFYFYFFSVPLVH